MFILAIFMDPYNAWVPFRLLSYSSTQISLTKQYILNIVPDTKLGSIPSDASWGLMLLSRSRVHFSAKSVVLIVFTAKIALRPIEDPYYSL